MDVRLAIRSIDELARWWTQASEEARYETLLRATKENSPPLGALRLAIYLAEAEAGKVEQVGEG